MLEDARLAHLAGSSALVLGLISREVWRVLDSFFTLVAAQGGRR